MIHLVSSVFNDKARHNTSQCKQTQNNKQNDVSHLMPSLQTVLFFCSRFQFVYSNGFNSDSIFFICDSLAMVYFGLAHAINGVLADGQLISHQWQKHIHTHIHKQYQ